MLKLNATQGRKEDGWFDGLQNIPPAWGLEKMRVLYEYDFDQPDKYEMPSLKRIRELANDSEQDDYVLIDIEGWNLVIPGTSIWQDWSKAPSAWQAKTPDAATWNQRCVDMRAAVLEKFKRFNQHSKVMWWATPGTNNQDQFWKRPNRGFRWPAAPGQPYHGYVGTEIWMGEQLRGLVDYACATGYWCDWCGAEYELDDWQWTIQHNKTVADAGYDAPLIVLLMNRRGGTFNSGYQWFTPPELDGQISFLQAALRPDDGIAWWDGVKKDLIEMDRQLAAYTGNEYWIAAFNEWFS
jgi:hypothetical protein